MLPQPVKISYSLKGVSISIPINVTNSTVTRLILQKFSILCYFLFPVPSFLTCISVPFFSDADSNSKTPKQDGPMQFHRVFIPIFSVNRNPQTGPSKAHQAISVTFHHDFNPSNSLCVRPFTKYFPSLSDFLTVFIIWPSWIVNPFPNRKCFLQKLSPFIWEFFFYQPEEHQQS